MNPIDKGPATVKANIGGISFMITPARAKMILELQKSIREQQKKEAAK